MAAWKRVLSNVFLGIALGLLSYYALTTGMGWLSQRQLHAEVADVAVFAAQDPAEAIEAPSSEAGGLDWAGWEEQDRAYWLERAEGDVFGRIVIDKIELDTLVLPGVTPAELRRGPGWIDWTQLPGPEGTCGIAGHRTTYGAPFRRLDELQPGDIIDVYSPYRRYRYEVSRSLVVRPDEIHVVAPAEEPMLTLTACHPPYSARYRLAVQAKLVEVVRLNAEVEAGPQ